SIEHAEDDIQKRQLREQQVDAERVLADLRKQLAQFPDALDAGERARLDAAVERVAQAARGTDSHAVKEALGVLEQASQPLVERVMNQAIAGALKGHSVEEY